MNENIPLYSVVSRLIFLIKSMNVMVIFTKNEMIKNISKTSSPNGYVGRN